MIKVAFSFLLLILPVIAWATQPKNVEVTADLKNNVLHVHAEHVSETLNKHYIRKMTVSINNSVIEPIYYHRQFSPAGLEADIPVKLKPNDRIRVELFCSKGGMATGELTVPAPQEDLSLEK